MSLTFLHILIISATVFAVIGSGFYVSRSVRSSAGYSVAGRSAGASLVAGSIAGTVVGGGGTVGTAQLAYSFGLSAWWFTLGSGIAFILMGIFYAKRLRNTALETIPQYLELYYGKKAEALSSIISSIGILLSAVASSLPGIEIISALFGLTPFLSALLLMALVIAYTFFGGMKSAAVSGILKMVIIWISLFISGVIAFLLLQENNILSSFPASHFDLMGQGMDSAMAHLFSVIVGVLCTQTYIQCIFSAGAPLKAASGCFIAALIVIPIGLPSVAVGMYMHAAEPGTLPILVLPTFLVNHVPVLIGGLAMSGIILSLLGSIGGLSLGIGTMISHDILSPLLKITDDKKLFRLTKLTVLAVMILASLIAIMNRGTEILFWNYLSMGLRGGGIFLPLTLAVFWPGHLNADWAVFSMAGSTIAAIIAALAKFPFDPLFIGLAVSFLLILPGLRLKKTF